MTLKLIETSFPEVLLIEAKAYSDSRGVFLETFHKEKYAEIGIDQDFVQDNYSHSKERVLRGLHFQIQRPQGKLVFVLQGEIFDVAVDIREGSPTFGQCFGVNLSAENKRQIYIPAGFAHGFCVVSESADVLYKCTDFYNGGDEGGIIWSDQKIGIDWPVTSPVISEKDKQFKQLVEIPDSDLPKYTSSKTTS